MKIRAIILFSIINLEKSLSGLISFFFHQCLNLREIFLLSAHPVKTSFIKLDFSAGFISLVDLSASSSTSFKEAGLKLGAVQNHYSLLNRSSEDSGILEYCKENDIIFFSYMVLEQGALSGKYDTAHPFPEGSDRANAYGESLAEIEELNNAIAEIAENHNAKVAQLPIAWAIAKGTLPIIGATKVHHVEDAADAVNIELSDDEIKTMEELADKANVNTIRIWEKEMK